MKALRARHTSWALEYGLLISCASLPKNRMSAMTSKTSIPLGSKDVIRFRCSGGMCLALGGKELHMQHLEGFFILLSCGCVTILASLLVHRVTYLPIIFTIT